MKIQKAKIFLFLTGFVALAIVTGGIARVLAQVGPSGGAGSGYGAISTDVYNDIGIGTSTIPSSNPSPGRIFVVATSSVPYTFEILPTTGNAAVFTIDNLGDVSTTGNLITTGKIGVGSSTPSTAVVVNGTVTASSFVGALNGTLGANNVSAGIFGAGSFAFPSGGSLGVATSSNVSLPQSLSVYGGGYFSGNVGIGTTTPGMKLDVYNGNIRDDTGTNGTAIINLGGVSHPNTGSIILSTGGLGGGYDQLWLAANESSQYTQTNISMPSWGIDIGGSNDGVSTVDTFGIARKPAAGVYSYFLKILNNGNVGIGTTTPSDLLDVGANGMITSFSNSSGGDFGFRILNMVGHDWRLEEGRSAATDFDISDCSAGCAQRIVVSGTTGYIGIGSSTPAYPLSVAGQVNATGFCINGTCTASWGGGGTVTSITMGAGLSSTQSPLTSAGTMSVVYGSSANTAAQGNVTHTGPAAGAGLSGGGGTIAVGTTGTFNTISLNLGSANTWTATQTFPTIIDTGVVSQPCVGTNSSGQLQAGTCGTGTIAANNVTAGVFGAGNFAFPSSLGVATGTQVSLPQALSVYGGGYFSGSVGIGTVSPATGLDLENYTSATDAITIGELSGGVTEGIIFKDANGSSSIMSSWWNSGGMAFTASRDITQNGFNFYSNSGVDTMHIDTQTKGVAIGTSYASTTLDAPANGLIVAGNVGIGTTTPGFPLTVSGTANVTGELYVNNNGSGTGSGSTGSIQLGDGTISKSYGAVFTMNSGLAISGANALTAGILIDTGLTSQNCVGTNSGGQLQAGTCGGGSVAASNVTAGVFGAGNFAFPSSLGVATGTQVSLPQPLSVYGNGYISGSLGIGTTAPGYLLTVNGTTSASAYYIGTSAALDTGGGGLSSTIYVGVPGSQSAGGTYDVSVGPAAQVGGTQNTAVGYGAGAGGSNGDTAIGYEAGGSSAGNYNTLVGDQIGYVQGDGTYTNNTVVGYEAGYNIGGGNNNNVLLGYGAGYNVAGSNDTVIGYNTENSNAANNTLDIGNLIYASGMSTFSSPSTAISTGNVGIGTASPGSKLDIAMSGNGELTHWFNGAQEVFGVGDYSPNFYMATYARTFNFGTNDNNPLSIITSSTARMVILGNGNVDVGTASSVGRLTVGTSATLPGSGIGSFGLVTSGSYGGGIGLQDGTGNIGIWDDTNGANFHIGFGTSLGALSTELTLTSGGNLTTVGSMSATALIDSGVTSQGCVGTNSSGQLQAGTCGASQWTTGSGLIYYTGGTVGIGTATPNTNALLANTGANYVDPAYGDSTNGLEWAATGGGYAAVLVNTYNAQNAPADGLLIQTPNANSAYLINAQAKGSTYAQTEFSVTGSGAGYFAGPVGIENASPAYALDITGTARASIIIDSGLTSQTCIGTNSAGQLVGSTCSGSGGSGTGTVTSIVAGTGLNGGTITTSGTISLNYGNQSTWTSPQTFNAGITDNGGSGATSINGGTYGLSLGTISGNVSIGNSGGTVTFNGPISINSNLNLGSYKITAGTFDPLYTIGGTNYATYLPGMTGQKEETAGTLDLVRNADGTYGATVDFATAAQGSDLWLFAKATNVANTMDQLIVNLTPSFNGNVWYTKDAAADTLTIHGAAAGEVSYNLTAPRFDAGEWTNLAPSNESTTKGLIIND
jgi:hypothetical protein